MSTVTSNLGLGPEVPLWPPGPGLVGPDWWFADRDTWQIAQWKEYARILEDAGHRIVAQLDEAHKEALILRGKLSRSKPVVELAMHRGLLDYIAAREPKLVGRPKGSSRNQADALDALIIKGEMTQKLGRRITNKQAVVELRQRRGDPNPHHGIRGVLNAMSNLAPKAKPRKSQKISEVRLDILVSDKKK